MPYNEKDMRQMLRDQTSHKIVFGKNWTPSEQAVALIKKMMHPRRELRATTLQIIESSWLKNCP